MMYVQPTVLAWFPCTQILPISMFTTFIVCTLSLFVFRFHLSIYVFQYLCVYVVRKVVHYSLEMEALGMERVEEKMKMCERLGDLCCTVRAFPAAIKFYEQQVSRSCAPV